MGSGPHRGLGVVAGICVPVLAILTAACVGGVSAATTAATVTTTDTTVTTTDTTVTTGATTTAGATTTTTTTRPEPFDPLGATIPELQAAMDAGRITSVDLVTFSLARITAYDDAGPELNAMITVNPNALADAAVADAERAVSGPRSPLHGIPIVVKDNIDTMDMPTTAGSLSLAGFMPGDDAFVVSRLRAGGAVIIGKANLHEFARDITTLSSLGGQTLNPFDPTRNPGGSSGGTGASVVAEFATAGLGTDTCGSIRIPASHDDLYGLRPTIGLVSRAGVIPLSPTEDTVGPLARSVADLAAVLDVIAGQDPADPITVATATSYADAVDPDGLTGMRIGVLDVLFTDADPGVAAVVRSALAEMEASGATVISASIPGFDALRGSAASVFLREFRDALDFYLTAHPSAPVGSLSEIVASGLYEQSLDAKLRAHLTASTRDTSYREAVARRAVVRDAIVSFMDDNDLDALAYPTITQPPARIGETQRGSHCGTASVGGLPALVVPAGFTDGLPVGLELMGRPFQESMLISIAAGFEAHTDHRMLPSTTPPLP